MAIILYINEEHCENIEDLKNYFINQLDSQKVVEDILDYGRNGDLSKWLIEKGEAALAKEVEEIDHKLCNTKYIEKLGSIIANRGVIIDGPYHNGCLNIEHISYNVESEHKISIILSFAILKNINEDFYIQINTNWGKQRTIINPSKFPKKYKSKMKFSFENKNNQNNFEGIQEILINGINLINDIPAEEYLFRFINHHEYVDLGLPSGLKWATCNVGANSPEDYGDYYAWGEIVTKESYRKDNCETHKKDIRNIEGNDEYDTAQKKWGGSWRLPTHDEYKELSDKCSWEWIVQNGINGYKITGENGNYIFLPAAGYITEKSLRDKNNNGKYWCSTSPEQTINNIAYSLQFDRNRIESSSYGCYRYIGQSIRPVSE